jgi:glycosyltransferase involved in cell wall biosynthesis
MKIAIVLFPWDEVYPPEQLTSSIVILAYEIARRMARAHEVILYARQGANQPLHEVDREGVQICRIPGIAKSGHQLLERILGALLPRRPLFFSQFYYFPYIQRVVRDLSRRQVDIVHVFSLSQFAPLVRARCPDAKIVLHMEEETLIQRDPRSAGRQLADIDLIIGCSQHVVDNIVESFPQCRTKCRALHNGVNTAHFINSLQHSKPSTGPRRILYVGRISPEKGLHVLLEAFCTLLQELPDCHLDVIGKPGLLPDSPHIALSRDQLMGGLRRFHGSTRLEILRKQLFDRGSSYLSYLRECVPERFRDHIVFHGVVPNNDIVSYYQRADLFVFPSVWHEPFGIPVVEAMACALPVVGTRSGGIAESIVDGETGILVQRADADGLAQALLRLLRSDALRLAMGEKARRRAETCFSWDRLVEALLEEYRSLRSAP